MTTTPSSAPLIAVSGASGRLGSKVAQRLSARGVPQRLLVRDLARVPRLPGATAAVAAYSDGGAARAALDGVHTLFMVSAFESPTRVPEHRTFIDAAIAAGVRHLVYTSFYGAAEDAIFTYARDHWQTEQHLRARGAAGLQWTFLRDNFYADFLLELVGRDNVLRGPAGDGRVAAVAQDDIADAAVAVLLDAPAHAGRTYDLTGPQSLTLAEVARILSAATGRDITYYAETLSEARASRAGENTPDWLIGAWISTYTAICAGEVAAVTNDVPALTGHPATSLEELLRLR